MPATLFEAFKNLESELNDKIPMPRPVSLYPKHPDYVEGDSPDAFPYLALFYASETPNYGPGSDIHWVKPSMELAVLRVYAVVGEDTQIIPGYAEGALGLNTMALVQEVRKVVRDITRNAGSLGYRMAVTGVTTDYDPANRWGWSSIDVTVGAYEFAE